MLIWVHGFNNDHAEAVDGFKKIEKSYLAADGICKVIGFAWRSDPGVEKFGTAEDAADLTANGPFAKYIRDLKAKCPNTKINIGSHSLGARVVLRALQTPGNGVSGIDQVILASAAVPRMAMSKASWPFSDGDFTDAPKYANKIHIAFNKDDMVLKGIYEVRKMTSALGVQGGTGDEPANVESKDFTADWSEGGHSSVYDSKYNQSFWKYYAPLINGNCK